MAKKQDNAHHEQPEHRSLVANKTLERVQPEAALLDLLEVLYAGGANRSLAHVGRTSSDTITLPTHLRHAATSLLLSTRERPAQGCKALGVYSYRTRGSRMTVAKVNQQVGENDNRRSDHGSRQNHWIVS